MRAIEISTPGAPGVLRLCELPQPTLRWGEVLIKVHAAGVNRPDVLQRMGLYPVPPGASGLPGLELAGEIVAAHESLDLAAAGFALGDAICALANGGAYAEYCAVPLTQCLPLPKGWSMLEAASLPETLFTVWSNVFQRAALQEGESLLVQGGSSGIGVTAIQLARALGHRVFATAGNAEKCRACEALGAERAIDYRTEDFVDVIKSLTGGKGVDVILDMVGGDYVPREINLLADDGRLVLIAFQRGSQTQLDLGQVLRRRLTVTGSTLRPRSAAFKAQIARELRGTVWPLLEKRAIRPVIHESFALEDAAKAHALMESSTHVGKLMLQVVA